MAVTTCLGWTKRSGALVQSRCQLNRFVNMVKEWVSDATRPTLLYDLSIPSSTKYCSDEWLSGFEMHRLRDTFIISICVTKRRIQTVGPKSLANSIFHSSDKFRCSSLPLNQGFLSFLRSPVTTLLCWIIPRDENIPGSISRGQTCS